MKTLSILGAAAALAAAALFLHDSSLREPRPRSAPIPLPAEPTPDAPAKAVEVPPPPKPDGIEAIRLRLEEDVDGPALAQRFQAETDAALLDVLQGILSAHPEEADRPGVLEVFLAIAAGDAHRARRQSALVYLGTAWDKDGRVLDVLLRAARAGDAELRLTAISALQDYGVKNPDRESGLVEGLLVLARRDPDPVLRAQCLVSLPFLEPSPERAGSVAVFLRDPSEDLRRAAAEKLATTPAELWQRIRAELTGASARESNPVAREAILAALAEGDARFELAGGRR